MRSITKDSNPVNKRFPTLVIFRLTNVSVYYAHLYYWQECEGTLTDYPIVRMPNGPGIDSGNTLLQELESEGRIRIKYEPEGPYREYSYALRQPYTIDPNNPRYCAIEKAVEFVKEKSAAELSQITHEHSRSW